MPILCPICENDDKIQKVSSVYLSGISFGHYEGPATSSGTTVSSTSLAKTLSPPLAPKKPSIPFYFYLGLVMFVGGIGFCLSTVLPTMLTQNITKINDLEGFILFTLCCAVIPIIFGIVTIFRGIVTKQKQVESYPGLLATYNKDLEGWNRQYYCHRDDAIFDPTTGEVWQFKKTS